jgi:hypothetical protein
VDIISLLIEAARLGASSGSIGSLQFGQNAFSAGTIAPQFPHLFVSVKLKTPSGLARAGRDLVSETAASIATFAPDLKK